MGVLRKLRLIASFAFSLFVLSSATWALTPNERTQITGSKDSFRDRTANILVVSEAGGRVLWSPDDSRILIERKG